MTDLSFWNCKVQPQWHTSSNKTTPPPRPHLLIMPHLLCVYGTIFIQTTTASNHSIIHYSLLAVSFMWPDGNLLVEFFLSEKVNFFSLQWLYEVHLHSGEHLTLFRFFWFNCDYDPIECLQRNTWTSVWLSVWIPCLGKLTYEVNQHNKPRMCLQVLCANKWKARVRCRLLI